MQNRITLLDATPYVLVTLTLHFRAVVFFDVLLGF